MAYTIKATPINSIVFISDSDRGEIPEVIRGAMISHTSSCIVVACNAEVDGPTEIALGRSDEVTPGPAPDFDGTLEVPRKDVVVWTVDDQVLLRVQIDVGSTRIRIWLSHPQWPEKVIIGLG